MRRFIAAAAALSTAALVGGALSAPASAAAPSSNKPVTIGDLPAQSQVGKRITVKGKVASGRATVRIQRKYVGSGWQNVASTTSARTGAYAVKVKLVRGGTTSFRAVKGSAKSSARSLKVYQWLDLTTQPHFELRFGGAGGAGPVNSPARIGGKRFATSFQDIEGETARYYNVADQCRRAEGWTGFLDSSKPDLAPTDRQRLEWLASDTLGPEAEIKAFETAPGKAVRRSMSTTGARIFAFALEVEQASSSTWPPTAVLGGPRVLCNLNRLPAMSLQNIPVKTLARTW